MTSSSAPRKTPLFETHQKWGGRMVDFAGWSMPVQYTSILEEHHAVRKGAGLFDISHMGELMASGSGSAHWLNTMLTNDVSKLTISMGQYTLMLNEQGGVIDDLLIYRLLEDTYLLVVNASHIEENFSWLQKTKPKEIKLENISDATAALALQGPQALAIFHSAFGVTTPIPKRNQLLSFTWGATLIRAARTGYTGEDGLELFFPASIAPALWEHLLEQGKLIGCQCLPAGLGARDTLRLEACLPLNGNDLSPSITPLEAGLSKFVSFTKPESFTGRAALEKAQSAPAGRASVAFTTEPGPPPRAHYSVYASERQVGEVTSGGVSPTLQKGIGMALIDKSFSAPGTVLEIDIRGRRVTATVQPKPLYKRSS